MNIVNVLRALEIVQLLKCSQSATERIFSIIARTVDGRYENRYRLSLDDTETQLEMKNEKL